MKSHSTKFLCSILFYTIGVSGLAAQNINIIPKKKIGPGAVGDQSTQISIPAGASAGVNTGASSADAGTLVGVQVSKVDNFFLNVSFRYAGAKKINGSQKDFGGFLLNPSTQGSSVAASLNKLFPLNKKGATIGVSGRLGASFTSWESITNQITETYDGFVLYLVPSLIISTKTYPVGDNEYQFAFEVGPSLRALGGDLGQAGQFLQKQDVLGVDKKSIFGLEATVSVRLNNIQPFLRLSHFGVDGNTVKGLSGLQGYIGINILSSFFSADLPN